jgi:hypothetical protein
VDISISPVFLQNSSFEITYMSFANHFFLSRVPIVWATESVMNVTDCGRTENSTPFWYSVGPW